MKKFLTSVIIGGLAGVVLAFAFALIVPTLPDIFASAFYQKIKAPTTNIALAIKEQFRPASNQYFIPSVDSAVAQEGKVVYADLGAMKITLFEDGQNIGEYPIASVGREGTAWQTPIGQFEMSYKMRNHFSSIGHVWMPYSMHFFGNYFIHGWPYSSNGTPVPEGYSGGCIRLETEIARQIYEFVDKQTKLVVTQSANQLEKIVDFEYVVNASAPEISGNYIVADIETGEVLDSKNPSLQVPAGAFTNLMTGIISLETLNQYQDAILEQGVVKISDVLYALLLADSSDAGLVLQNHKNKHQYLLDMNTRAQSVGMDSTKYMDVTGEMASTVSTLEDTFKLVQYVAWYKPFVTKALSLSKFEKGMHTWNSTHSARLVEGFVAGSANHEQTEMFTIVDMHVPGEKSGATASKKIVILVQGSQDAASDTFTLHHWMKNAVKLREEK